MWVEIWIFFFNTGDIPIELSNSGFCLLKVSSLKSYFILLIIWYSIVLIAAKFKMKWFKNYPFYDIFWLIQAVIRYDLFINKFGHLTNYWTSKKSISTQLLGNENDGWYFHRWKPPFKSSEQAYIKRKFWTLKKRRISESPKKKKRLKSLQQSLATTIPEKETE